MRCPTCGQAAELLKNPCCESAWADHVVSHPTEAVAALQRGDYEGAMFLASEQLAIAFGVVVASRELQGKKAPGAWPDALTTPAVTAIPPIGESLGVLVKKLRASIGRVSGATVSRDEQHTLEHLLTLRLSWRERLRVLWRGRLDIVAAVRTERLAGRASWACRVVE